MSGPTGGVVLGKDFGGDCSLESRDFPILLAAPFGLDPFPNGRIFSTVVVGNGRHYSTTGSACCDFQFLRHLNGRPFRRDDPLTGGYFEKVARECRIDLRPENVRFINRKNYKYTFHVAENCLSRSGMGPNQRLPHNIED